MMWSRVLIGSLTLLSVWLSTGCASARRDAGPGLGQSGHDIVAALRQGKVQVESTGSGLGSVTLRIKRKIDRPVSITVPIGTFFDCRGSAQNMITTASNRIDLEDDEWHTLMVEAACVDRLKSVPQSGDAFDIRRSAKKKDLKKLMELLRTRQLALTSEHESEVLDSMSPGELAQLAIRGAEERARKAAEASFQVQQAAIWIVMDNANYADLGILTRSAWGARVINESDAAMAMKLVDQAGINITRKAIWRDRQTIAQALSDPSLRAWIERRANR